MAERSLQTTELRDGTEELKRLREEGTKRKWDQKRENKGPIGRKAWTG